MYWAVARQLLQAIGTNALVVQVSEIKLHCRPIHRILAVALKLQARTAPLAFGGSAQLSKIMAMCQPCNDETVIWALIP